MGSSQNGGWSKIPSFIYFSKFSSIIYTLKSTHVVSCIVFVRNKTSSIILINTQLITSFLIYHAVPSFKLCCDSVSGLLPWQHQCLLGLLLDSCVQLEGPMLNQPSQPSPNQKQNRLSHPKPRQPHRRQQRRICSLTSMLCFLSKMLKGTFHKLNSSHSGDEGCVQRHPRVQELGKQVESCWCVSSSNMMLTNPNAPCME